MAEAKTYGWAVKIAVLLLLFIQMLQSLVNPSLTGIMGEFPGAAPTTYQMIINIATITEMVAALVVGGICRKAGFKTLAVLGSLLALIGGVAPIFLPCSIPLLIAYRAVFGIGYGFVYALAVAAVGEFWRGKEASQVSGLISLAAGFAGIIYNLAESAIIAALGDVNWRVCYHINWVCVPILIYCLIFMPQRNAALAEEMAAAKESGTAKSAGLAGLGAKFWVLMVAVVLTLGAVCVFMNNIAMVVLGAGMSPASIGIIMTGFCVGIMLGGPFYIATYRALRRYAMPFYLLVDFIFFLVMMFVPNYIAYIIAGVVIGTVFGSINSSWYDMAAKKVVAYPEASTLAGTIYVVVAGIAQFIGPFWVAFLGTAIFRQPETNPFYQYYPALVCLAVGAIFLFVMAAKNHGKPEYERDED